MCQWWWMLNFYVCIVDSPFLWVYGVICIQLCVCDGLLHFYVCMVDALCLCVYGGCSISMFVCWMLHLYVFIVDCSISVCLWWMLYFDLFMVDHSISVCFLCLQRLDGRQTYDYRKIKITFGTDYGCCFVDLGKTR